MYTVNCGVTVVLKLAIGNSKEQSIEDCDLLAIAFRFSLTKVLNYVRSSYSYSQLLAISFLAEQ